MKAKHLSIKLCVCQLIADTCTEGNLWGTSTVCDWERVRVMLLGRVDLCVSVCLSVDSRHRTEGSVRGSSAMCNCRAAQHPGLSVTVSQWLHSAATQARRQTQETHVGVREFNLARHQLCTMADPRSVSVCFFPTESRKDKYWHFHWESVGF